MQSDENTASAGDAEALVLELVGVERRAEQPASSAGSAGSRELDRCLRGERARTGPRLLPRLLGLIVRIGGKSTTPEARGDDQDNSHSVPRGR